MIPRRPKELCANCKWYSKEYHTTTIKGFLRESITGKYMHMCQWQDYKWDVVTGEKIWSEPRNEDCYTARDEYDGFCRPQALYFIPK